MSKLITGDTLDLDDLYQDSIEYADDKAQWALTQDFKHCDMCQHDFENETTLNEHICSD